MISDKDTFSRNEEKFLFSNLGDEAVMMDLESGNYIGLNPVASTIWENLETPTTIDEMVLQLKEVYDTSIEECKKDIIPFLNDMLNKEMLIIK